MNPFDPAVQARILRNQRKALGRRRHDRAFARRAQPTPRASRPSVPARALEPIGKRYSFDELAAMFGVRDMGPRQLPDFLPLIPTGRTHHGVPTFHEAARVRRSKYQPTGAVTNAAARRSAAR